MQSRYCPTLWVSTGFLILVLNVVRYSWLRIKLFCHPRISSGFYCCLSFRFGVLSEQVLQAYAHDSLFWWKTSYMFWTWSKVTKIWSHTKWPYYRKCFPYKLKPLHMSQTWSREVEQASLAMILYCRSQSPFELRYYRFWQRDTTAGVYLHFLTSSLYEPSSLSRMWYYRFLQRDRFYCCLSFRFGVLSEQVLQAYAHDSLFWWKTSYMFWTW